MLDMTDKFSNNSKTNKGGRPQYEDDKKKKKHKYTVYFNTYEKEIIDLFIEDKLDYNPKYGPLFKDIIINTVQSNKINIINVRPTLELSAINSVGNNLNQIAKKLNSIDHLNENDLKKLDEVIDKLLTLIQS